ncbi:hypothetical protein SKAU_G00202940 [Synaphobranchus kaupii]|uniref:Uncharacterized protein n=1 Tax=Synaphobranchus kaupii TaxID=118154 RepID=A0A9Q1FG79_SYNKA|nr:hypothetical protein SKAU_G00202940 [Synaphobranchus kaupii]
MGFKEKDSISGRRGREPLARPGNRRPSQSPQIPVTPLISKPKADTRHGALPAHHASPGTISSVWLDGTQGIGGLAPVQISCSPEPPVKKGLLLDKPSLACSGETAACSLVTHPEATEFAGVRRASCGVEGQRPSAARSAQPGSPPFYGPTTTRRRGQGSSSTALFCPAA